MNMRRLTLTVAALTALALSGCANGAAEVPAAQSSASPSDAFSSSAEASAPVSPPADPVSPPAGITPPAESGKPSGSASADSAGAVRVTGVVTAGVEPNCKLISDGTTDYLLVGGDPAVVKVGARITVTGTAQVGMMTTCQQGTPLTISAAEPA